MVVVAVSVVVEEERGEGDGGVGTAQCYLLIPQLAFQLLYHKTGNEINVLELNLYLTTAH